MNRHDIEDVVRKASVILAEEVEKRFQLPLHPGDVKRFEQIAKQKGFGFRYMVVDMYSGYGYRANQQRISSVVLFPCLKRNSITETDKYSSYAIL